MFVDGCFWHGCAEHGTAPRANSAWWREKISTNKARDADTDEVLAGKGWTVVRVWEHEKVTAVADRIVALVRPEQTRVV